MQHTRSRLAATPALAPLSAKVRAIAMLMAFCVAAMGIAPRAGADPPDPPGPGWSDGAWPDGPVRPDGAWSNLAYNNGPKHPTAQRYREENLRKALY
jgi:hypothetical protein